MCLCELKVAVSLSGDVRRVIASRGRLTFIPADERRDHRPPHLPTLSERRDPMDCTNNCTEHVLAI